MKIAFLISDVKLNETLYRAKKKNAVTYDVDGNIATIELKTFAKTKYDLLEVESVELFANLYPSIHNATEMWEIEPDALPN